MIDFFVKWIWHTNLSLENLLSNCEFQWWETTQATVCKGNSGFLFHIKNNKMIGWELSGKNRGRCDGNVMISRDYQSGSPSQGFDKHLLDIYKWVTEWAMSSQIRGGNLQNLKEKCEGKFKERDRMRFYDQGNVTFESFAKLLLGIVTSICIRLAKRPAGAWNWHLPPCAAHSLSNSPWESCANQNMSYRWGLSKQSID